MPCSNCVRHNCAELCEYDKIPPRSPEEEIKTESPDFNKQFELHLQSLARANQKDAIQPSSPWATSPHQPISQIVVDECSFLNGINPIVPGKHKMNFHMDFSCIDDNVGPEGFRCFNGAKRLARPSMFVNLSQQDPGAKLFWRIEESNRDMKLITLLGFSHKQQIKTTEEVKDVFGDRYIPNALDLMSNGTFSLSETKKVLSRHGLPLGISFSDDDLGDLELALRRVLPPKPVLLGLLARFFRVVYPHVPVVDEMQLFKDFNRILSFAPQHVNGIHILSRDDLATLAAILLALRLLYLSLFSNIRGINEAKLRKPAQVADEHLLLMQSPITLTVVNLASDAILKARLPLRPLLQVLQALILMSYYRFVAPELEAGCYTMGTDFLPSALARVAMALSLDKDPISSWDRVLDARQRNLRRKIWFFLVQYDFTLLYLFFTNPAITPNLYDTKFPEYSADSSNVSDEVLEQQVLQTMKTIHEVFSAGKDLLAMCVDMRNAHRTCDFAQLVNDFELAVQEKLGSVKDYFQPEDAHSLLKVLKLQAQTTLRLFLATVYYFLHLYYKCRSNKSGLHYFFFRKLVIIIFNEMNYYTPELFFVCDKYFNSSFTMALTPVILVFTHIVSIVGLGLCIRLNCSMIVLQSSGDNQLSFYMLLRTLLARTELTVLRKLKVNKLLSERYFYAWKSVKANGYGYRTVYLNRLYNGDIQLLEKETLGWSEKQQLELSDTIPPDIPPELAMDEDILSYCYYSTRSADEMDLRGLDLVKTVQTDNLWISYNLLSDRDPYQKREEPHGPSHVCGAVVPTGHVPQAPMAPVNGQNGQNGVPMPNGPMANGPNGAPPQPHPNGVPNGQLVYSVPVMEPFFANDLLDFNVFSTDWAIEDFYPVNAYE